MSSVARRALHHVALGTADVERLAAFYRDVLGLPERARHHDDAGQLRSIWLDMDGPLLMIERSEEPSRHVSSIGMGPFLIALCVAPDERAEVERALQRAGASVEARSAYSSYARDPDGNRVAVSHYPEPALGAHS